MPGTRANTIADRNPDSMHDPDSPVNPSTCTKDTEEPLIDASLSSRSPRYTESQNNEVRCVPTAFIMARLLDAPAKHASHNFEQNSRTNDEPFTVALVHFGSLSETAANGPTRSATVREESPPCCNTGRRLRRPAVFEPSRGFPTAMGIGARFDGFARRRASREELGNAASKAPYA